ncbi:hypothetical protein DY000_02052882 [Brassica cretica]|uniref:Uncharacterized protein n=1 Tax=Brassica cretica TaxID=69181 RepID=A0ABQ7ABJ8_BRACR|nr:hypothetical protein DY000_02052882 [Brassica cretica]
MSPILDRIVRTDLGARRRTSQSWSSVTVARRCNGEAQSAHGISEVAHQVSLRWVSWGSAQLSWTECSGLGPLGQVWVVTGPVGLPRLAMDRWALLVWPLAWAICVGFSLTCLGVDKQAHDVWRASPWVFKHARASSYTLKHKETQRKVRELVGFNIQDQEWCEGPENTRRFSEKKRDGRIPLHMAKIALRGDVCGKAVSWELGTTLGWPDFTLHSQDNFKGGCSVEAVTWEFHVRDVGATHGEILSILGVNDMA